MLRLFAKWRYLYLLTLSLWDYSIKWQIFFNYVLFGVIMLILQSVTFAQDLLPTNLILVEENTVFLVDKTQRKLHVYQPDANKKLIQVDIRSTDIGKNKGNKEKENDHRTPEGIYFLQKKNYAF